MRLNILKNQNYYPFELKLYLWGLKQVPYIPDKQILLSKKANKPRFPFLFEECFQSFRR